MLTAELVKKGLSLKGINNDTKASSLGDLQEIMLQLREMGRCCKEDVLGLGHAVFEVT